MARPINVTITGDYKDADIKRAIKDLQSLQKQAPATSKQMSGLSKTIKGVGLAIGATAVVAGMKSFIQNSIGMAVESQKTIDRLDAVAKSMGVYYEELGGTTSRLQSYAQELQNVTGVSDETTKSAQAILLTFSNLASTAGQAGGMFDRATASLLDLSAAGFGDAETNAKSLGKALQDPIKGITALSRQGITFEATERAKIKALVESNRLLEAQEIIMGAVEMQVGGAARSMANDFDKISAAVDDAQELIGTQLLNASEDVIKSFGGSGGLKDTIDATGDTLADFTAGLGDGITGLIEFGKNASNALTGSNSTLGDLIGTVYRLTPGLGGLIQTTEGLARSGDASRKAAEESEQAFDGYYQAIAAYDPAAKRAAAASEDLDEEVGNVGKTAAKAKSQVDRLQAALDKLRGKTSIKRQRLDLADLLQRGPAQSGERTVVGADGTETTQRFSTRRDKKRFALDVADARRDLAFDIFQQGGETKEAKERARRQLRLGRQNLAGLGLGGFTEGLLATPAELQPQNATGVRGVEAARMAGVTNVYQFGDIKVNTLEDAIEQAKRAERLRALGGRGAAASAARYTAMAAAS